MSEAEHGEALLAVRDLVKDFGGLRAIDHCTLGVRRGTLTGLIGPNGAGKTTLFNIVTGFIRPDAGRVFFRGEDVTSLPPHRIFAKRLCSTFQIPREHQSMTVLENLMLVPPRQLGERLWNNWLRPARWPPRRTASATRRWRCSTSSISVTWPRSPRPTSPAGRRSSSSSPAR